MKLTKILFVLMLISTISSSLCAQENASHVSDITKTLNIGIGASSWGIPVYANIEFPLNNTKAVTLAVGGSYQTKKETFGYFLGNYSWRHSIIGLQVAGNYYVDELFELPDAFDLYGGLQIEYYVWKTKLTDDGGLGFNENYSGSGAGGLGLSGFVGGRYHFGNTDKLSLNIQLGAGTVFFTGRLGVSIKI